jgi:hypothetical protein
MLQKQHQRVNVLSDQGVLTERVHGWFNDVRKIGNRAVPEDYAAQRDALQLVRTCYELGAWFHRTVSGSRDAASPFVPSQPGASAEPASADDSHALGDLRQLLQRYHAELVEMKTKVDEQTAAAVAEAAAQAATHQEILRAVRAQASMHQLIQQLFTKVDGLQRQLSARASAAVPIDSARRGRSTTSGPSPVRSHVRKTPKFSNVTASQRKPNASRYCHQSANARAYDFTAFGDACWAQILQVPIHRLDHSMVPTQHRPRALTRRQGQPL